MSNGTIKPKSEDKELQIPPRCLPFRGKCTGNVCNDWPCIHVQKHSKSPLLFRGFVILDATGKPKHDRDGDVVVFARPVVYAAKDERVQEVEVRAV